MKSRHGAALLAMEMSCRCPCHTTSGAAVVSHVVACCCVHGKVVGCKECP